MRAPLLPIGATVLLTAVAGCEPGAVRPRAGGAAGFAGSETPVIVVRDAAAGSDVATAHPAGAGGDGGTDLRTTGNAAGAAGGVAPGIGGAGGTAGRPAPEVPDAGLPDRGGAGGAGGAGSDGATPARPPRAGEVAVDELLVNPNGDDLGREWIEIVSRAAEPVDLSALHLATASTDVAAAVGVLAPGALLLLGQSADPSKNGGAPVAVAYGTKLILVNSDGQLSLCLGPCASGVVIDRVAWGALGDDATGHALVIDPETEAICLAETPFGDGSNCGTPGAPNPPCVSHVDGGPNDGADGGSLRDVSVAD